MNPNFKKLISSIITLTGVCALALGALFFSPVSAARAEDGAPGPFGDGSALEFACKQAKLMLEGQQNRIDFANDVVGKTQTWIDQLKSEGKDPRALESALADYKAALIEAQGQHAEAQNAFDTHTGFNGNSCQVADKAAAKETLKATRSALREAGETLREATQDFRQAVREWRQANRPAASGTPTP